MNVRFSAKTLLTACAALALGASASAATTTVIDEDFESYADTAALGGAWALSDGTLDTVLGNGGNSLNHPATSGSFSGGNTNSQSFTAIQQAADTVIRFSVDIYDDGTSANKRVSAGLRAAAASNLIELGMYNSPSHYVYRQVLFAAGNPSWVAFSDIVDDAGDPIANAPVEGWHTFAAKITEDEITYTLDLNGDGFINASSTVAATATASGWDIVRLGGPSDLSSAGGGANFDNISLTVTVIPAPAAATTGLLLAGLGAMRRRR